MVLMRRGVRSPWRGRSACRACARVLSALELIPLISFAALRGRCRTCGATLSLQYPAVELLTGFLFLFSSLALAPQSSAAWGTLAFWWIAMSFFVLIAVYDWRHALIPDEYLIPFAAAGAAYALYTAALSSAFGEVLLDRALAAVLLFLPFYALWHYSEGRWIGLADGKLAAALGVWLGLSQGLSAVALSFWVGAAVVLLFMAAQRLLHYRDALTMKSEIPFGPFMVAGALLVLFFDISAVDATQWLVSLFPFS